MKWLPIRDKLYIFIIFATLNLYIVLVNVQATYRLVPIIILPFWQKEIIYKKR